MFCQKCGHQNPDNADVCASCGTSLKLQPAVEPAQPQVTTPAAPQPAQPKSNKGVIIALICVIVAIAVGVGAFFIFGNKGDKSSSKEDTEANVVETSASAEEVAKKYLKCQFEYNAEGILECWHEKMIEVSAKDENMSVSEYEQSFIEEIKALKKESEEKYGGFAVDVTVISSEKLTGDDFEDLKEEVEDYYGLTISEACKINVSLSITFESYPDKSSENKTSAYVAKIGSGWYVINFNN